MRVKVRGQKIVSLILQSDKCSPEPDSDPLFLSPPGRHRGGPVQRPDPALFPAGAGPDRRLQPDLPLRPAHHHLPPPGPGPLLLQPGHLEHLAGRHRSDPGHGRRRGPGLPRQPPPGPVARPDGGAAPLHYARHQRRAGGRGHAAARPGRAGAGGHAGADEGRHHPAGVLGVRGAQRRREEGQAAHGGGAALPLHCLRGGGLQRALPGPAALQLHTALLTGEVTLRMFTSCPSRNLFLSFLDADMLSVFRL